jgi:hypothetical protein
MRADAERDTGNELGGPERWRDSRRDAAAHQRD